MKNIIVTCKHKMSLLSRYFRPYLDPYIPEQKSLAQIQAEAWVEVLRDNYTREQQNEILSLAGKILIERREQEIADTFKDLTNLRNTKAELCNLRLI